LNSIFKLDMYVQLIGPHKRAGRKRERERQDWREGRWREDECRTT